jgi:hypothetical protein
VEQAGLERWMTECLQRLEELESRRPSIGQGLRRFDEVRAYRENVARLSLATLVAIGLDADCLEEGLRATQSDDDVAAMFGMAMQCQVIDDVIDYKKDLAARLPSFLTASASLSDALALTAGATRAYATRHGRSTERAVFPLDAALHVLSMVAALVVAAARILARLRLRPLRHVTTAPHRGCGFQRPSTQAPVSALPGSLTCRRARGLER